MQIPTNVKRDPHDANRPNQPYNPAKNNVTTGSPTYSCLELHHISSPSISNVSEYAPLGTVGGRGKRDVGARLVDRHSDI
jgi:hypothetical protein